MAAHILYLLSNSAEEGVGERLGKTLDEKDPINIRAQEGTGSSSCLSYTSKILILFVRCKIGKTCFH